MIVITDNMITFSGKRFEIKMIFDEIEKIEGGYMIGEKVHYIDDIIENLAEIINKTIIVIMEKEYMPVTVIALKMDKVWGDFMDYVAGKFKEG